MEMYERPYERLRACRAEAMVDFRKIKSRMKNAPNWDHYEWLAQFARIRINEHRTYSRYLREANQ